MPPREDMGLRRHGHLGVGRLQRRLHCRPGGAGSDPAGSHPSTFQTPASCCIPARKGEIYLRLFSYVRYLNQRNIDGSYTDAFGVEHTVQQRQDVQLAKFFAPFSGWFLTPKFRYYLYVWSSNASQGDPAQVVGAGNLSYTFNRFVSVGGGITSLPTVRSTEGQFPYWLGVDGRTIADEFFRGSYTNGVWVKGDLSAEAEIQRDVRHQSEHPRRERLADRQQDGHAVLRAEVAADDGRVRSVGDVRRLRLPRDGGDAGRRPLVAQSRGQTEPAGHERASRTARSA